MADKYPPILEIPVSKDFRNITDTQIELLFDEPKETEGKFGPQFMYRVSSEGTEYTLFASKALHRQIQEHNPGKGTVLSIARVGTGKDTRWDCVYVSGPREEGQSSSGESKPATPKGPDAAGFRRDLQLYWDSFDVARNNLSAQGIEPSVDLNAVAFVIYRIAKDHGVTHPANPEGNGSAEPRTSTAAVEKDARVKMRDELEKLFRKTDLHEKDWLFIINAHAPEGKTIDTWEELTRDVGLAVYATAKNVETGVSTWEEYGISSEETDEDAPF